MKPSLEEDLLRELDLHDALAARCARGELSWTEFEAAYDGFFPRHPLDGYDGSSELLVLLDQYADRVTLHRQIWEQVLTKVTNEALLDDRGATDLGLIGPTEAIRRIQDLVRTHLGV